MKDSTENLIVPKSLNRLTEGSILKALTHLTIPIILANVLQAAYELTDTFWVGRLGKEAVASVSISVPIIFLIISFGGGLAMAGTILVAQLKGKNNQKAIDHTTSQTLMMVFIISIILATIGYYLAPFIVKIMGAESFVYSNAVSYMKISFIGMIFMFIFMVFQSLMRGIGNVKTPAYVVLTTVLLNLVLDPLFIFGYGIVPALGVSGAAMATVTTQGIAAIIGIILLKKGKYHITLHFKDLKPDLKIVKKIFKLGIPTSIEHSTRALGMTLITFLVASFGTLTIAAYGIGSRILSFVIIIAMSISMATSTLVGQNIGAEKKDRIDKIVKLSCKAGFLLLSIIGILIFIFAENIAGLFIPEEIDTIKSSSLFIKITALTFGFVGIQMSLSGALRGAGNTLAPMIISIISLWCLTFPIAYILSMHTNLGEVGLWIAFPATNIIAAIITGLWFKTGKWKHKRILDNF